MTASFQHEGRSDPLKYVNPTTFHWIVCSKQRMRAVMYLGVGDINVASSYNFIYWILELFWQSLSVTYGRSVVFSGYSGFPWKKTDHHDIAEILLKVALNTITLTPDNVVFFVFSFYYTLISVSSHFSFNLEVMWKPVQCLWNKPVLKIWVQLGFSRFNIYLRWYHTLRVKFDLLV